MSAEDNSDKIRTILVLTFLVVAAFFSRFYVFLKPQVRSVDEVVYFNLGYQLTEDLSNYNSINVARYLVEERDRILPPYFTQPLFKHPPLYPLMIAGALRLFGDHYATAEVVSLGTAVLMIPLIYLIGVLLFDARVGLLAAFFLFIDPINIMTSQKVWMDMPLAFFTFLSLYIYIRGIKRESSRDFIMSGIYAGLATLTKYPGILATFVQMMYSAMVYPKLYRKKIYIGSLFIPLLMLLPWLYWNYRVYGLTFLQQQVTLHSLLINYQQTIRVLIFVVCLVVLCLLYLVTRLKKKLFAGLGEILRILQKRHLRIMLAMLFYSFFLPEIFANLNLYSFPRTSWANVLFSQEGWGFYFGRLMEYSLIYGVAFLSFFLRFREKTEEILFLKLTSLVLLVFYSIYRNFQCRYVVAALPFLIVLGCYTLNALWDYFNDHPNKTARRWGRIGLISLITFIVGKTMMINCFVSFTNDMCYF
jgi:4-amino-4-deoxy-L-arabinose transferase-like glycosyltransferase